ncbi:MAG: phosphatase PAP2 family protein [Gemmatimonadota bacterium]|nr:MAG: phosphatase PAP2 family protein [Gemmatimonadota bacterium]
MDATARNRETRSSQLAFLLGSAGLAAFFILAPGVDLWLSGLFYDSTRGFYLDGALWVQFFYRLIPPLAAAIAAALLALLAYTQIRERALGPFNTRVVLFLLAALAAGPGLLVHTVFKDQWGRARPRDIVEFGGDKAFTPAFVISDQCERNCSFVAGHPSVPFYLLAVALLARRRRRTLFAGTIGFGALVGLGRIVQGAHFLSDVVFSGIFVFLVVYLLCRFVFRLDQYCEETGSD